MINNKESKKSKFGRMITLYQQEIDRQNKYENDIKKNEVQSNWSPKLDSSNQLQTQPDVQSDYKELLKMKLSKQNYSLTQNASVKEELNERTLGKKWKYRCFVNSHI